MRRKFSRDFWSFSAGSRFKKVNSMTVQPASSTCGVV